MLTPKERLIDFAAKAPKAENQLYVFEFEGSMLEARNYVQAMRAVRSRINEKLRLLKRKPKPFQMKFISVVAKTESLQVVSLRYVDESTKVDEDDLNELSSLMEETK